jgi:SPP1 gp7 family putative phage head morphogenesis protein
MGLVLVSANYGARVPGPLATSGWLKEAIDRWQAEKAIPPALFDLLPPEMQLRAGALADQWDRLFVNEIYDSLAEAAANGETMETWREVAQRIVDKYGAADNAPQLFPGGDFSNNYADTVYRTNMAQISAAGRYAEMWSRKWVELSPYWLFNAIEDERICDICGPLDGRVFAKDDESAQNYLPALHPQCRCSVIELDEAAVQEGGYDISTGGDLAGEGITPADGFGGNKLEDLVPGFLIGVNLTP